jgi:putative endonuclease
VPGANLAPMLTTSELGRLGEDLAASYLISRGWSILDRNWRSRSGEIDLIGVDDGVLVIVEVKTRRSTRYGLPVEAITDVKARRLRILAGSWLQTHQHPHVTGIRIDAIGVILDPDGLCSIDHRKAVA